MEQSSWLAKANVQARHFAGKADLVCLHLSVVVQECISLIISATLMCKWTVALLHVISSKCRSSAAAGPSIMACVMHFMLASTPALCVDAACSLMHICLIAQAAFQSIKLDQLAPKPEFLIVHSTHMSCYPMIVCREGMGDEGGLAVASRRFLFTYDWLRVRWLIMQLLLPGWCCAVCDLTGICVDEAPQVFWRQHQLSEPKHRQCRSLLYQQNAPQEAPGNFGH